MLKTYWKADFEEQAREAFRQILDDLSEKCDTYGNAIIFPWVGEHTYSLMAHAAGTVLEAMMEQEMCQKEITGEHHKKCGII